MAEVSALRDLEELRGYTQSNPLSVSQQEAIEELSNRQKAASAAGTVSPFESSWKPWNPNFRATAQNAISNMLGGSNISSSDNYLGGRVANTLTSLLDFAPGLGDGMGIGDTMTSYRQGDIPGTVINAAATGIGVLPLVGGPASKIVKAGGNRFRSSLRNIGDAQFNPPDIQNPPIITRTASPALIKAQSPMAGAPRGLETQDQLLNLRNNLYSSMERGIPGRSWYDNSSDSAGFLTGNRPGYRDAYTGTTAITSAGVSVPANQTFGVKGYNQFITGNDFSTGQYPANTTPALDSLRSGQPTSFGRKTGPFYEALNATNPIVSVGRPTNDIWMARAFDYRTPTGDIWSEGLGSAQHRFMDQEMNRLTDLANKNKLGGFDDWTPEKVQASIWVDTKAAQEGKTIEQAMGDFSHGLDRFNANINVESEPSQALNHLAGTRTNPEAAASLAEGQRQVLSNESGQDLIALSAGGLTRETGSGYGYYKPPGSPAGSVESDVVRMLAGPGTATNVIDQSSKQVVEGVAATHGLVRGQDSVGYNFLRGEVNALDRNAVQLKLGRVLDQDEMLGFGDKLSEEFGGFVFPTNTDDGINLLTGNFRSQEGVMDGALDIWALKQKPPLDPADTAKVAKAWQKKLSQMTDEEFGSKILKDKGMAQWRHNSGDLIGSDSYKPSEYMQVIDQSGPGVIEGLDAAARPLAGLLDDLDGALKESFPNIGERSKILQLTRQALTEGGFARVRELVAQGILPAVVLGISLRNESGQAPSPSEQYGAI